MSESIEVRANINVAGMRRGEVKRIPAEIAMELLDGGLAELTNAEARDSAPAAEPDLPETEEIVVVDDEVGAGEVAGSDPENDGESSSDGYFLSDAVDATSSAEAGKETSNEDPPEGDDGSDSDNGEDIDPATAAALAAAQAEDPNSSWRG